MYTTRDVAGRIESIIDDRVKLDAQINLAALPCDHCWRPLVFRSNRSANVMSTTDPVTIRAVQSALRQRHYYNGQVDGFFGQATAVAIERFQMDHDLWVKSVIDRSLLLALGITKH